MKKENIYWGMGIILILILLFGNQLGLFAIEDYPWVSGEGIKNHEYTGVFDEVSFSGKTAFLGSLISLDHDAFCNDNDGKFQIINSNSDGNSLYLYSRMKSTESRPSDCSQYNYNYVEFVVPPGSLEVNYHLISSICENIPSSCNLQITGGEGFSIFSHVSDNIPLEPTREVEGIKVLEFDEPTPVKVGLLTHVCNSVVEVTLNFEPKIESEPEPETVTYYRFLNNQCSVINILPPQKTVNDYNTLGECDVNILGGTEDLNSGDDLNIWEQYKIFIIIGGVLFLFLIIKRR